MLYQDLTIFGKFNVLADKWNRMIFIPLKNYLANHKAEQATMVRKQIQLFKREERDRQNTIPRLVVPGSGTTKATRTVKADVLIDLVLI